MTVKLPNKQWRLYRRFKKEFLLARFFFLLVGVVTLGIATLFHFTKSGWGLFFTICIVLILTRAFFWFLNKR